MSSKSRGDGKDFYETPPVVLMPFERLIRAVRGRRTVVDLGAGRGALIGKVPSRHTRVAVELDSRRCTQGRKRHPSVSWNCANALTFVPGGKTTASRTVAIMNPPFKLAGVGNAAIAFFNHAATWADVIIGIFPSTMTRPNNRNALDKHFHCLSSTLVKRAPFRIVDGSERLVSVVVELWERRSTTRRRIPIGDKTVPGLLSFSEGELSGSPYVYRWWTKGSVLSTSRMERLPERVSPNFRDPYGNMARLFVSRKGHSQWKRIHLSMMRPGGAFRKFMATLDLPACYGGEYVYWFRREAARLKIKLAK